MEAIAGMKVFEVSEDEWYVAATKEEAEQCAVENEGGSGSTWESLSADGLLFKTGARELSDAEMDSNEYADEDGDDKVMSFRAHLESETPSSPRHFASGNI